MRGWWLISVLALASCGEYEGWNPNYRFGATPYGKYLVARETALTTGKLPPATIPIALPAQASTAADITGQKPVPAGAATGTAAPRRVVAVTTTTAVPATPAITTTTTIAAAPAPAMPVTTSSRYPGSVPVLVRYASEPGHAPGRSIYGRPTASAEAAARACATYASPDAAQMAFLAAGGPRRDPLGLDPDGDGYVCGWDPAPFRADLP